MNVLFLLLAATTSTEEKLQDAQKRLTESRASLTFNTYSSPAHRANSHLIVSNDSAMLVDGQRSEKDTLKLLKTIREVGKPLVSIFITSPREEHWLGLPTLQKAYPDAKIYAPKAIAPLVGATPWTEASFVFAGERMEVLPLQRGASDQAVALYLPTLQVLLAGDLVWVNAPTASLSEEWRGLDKAAWAKRLDSIRKGRAIGTVLSGHGDIGADTLLDAMKKTLGK